MAGLLTYSIRKRLPIIRKITVVRVFAFELFAEFTAAGLSGIYTRFPFIACFYTKINEPITPQRYMFFLYHQFFSAKKLYLSIVISYLISIFYIISICSLTPKKTKNFVNLRVKKPFFCQCLRKFFVIQ
jgi:hypothetical protein